MDQYVVHVAGFCFSGVDEKKLSLSTAEYVMEGRKEIMEGKEMVSRYDSVVLYVKSVNERAGS